MSLIVSKFGGSSVASIERIMEIAERMKKMHDEGHKLVVVVSAMGDTTDDLIALTKHIGNDLDSREIDSLLSTGEQQAAALTALSMQSLGCDAVSLAGWQAGISSDSHHSKARIMDIDNTRIEQELQRGKIAVIAGFQGLTREGNISTLGRGGSDTTAVALAASLNASRCIIFTDVDGVYTTDPRVVKAAQKIPVISYDEMLEMASLGAVVLQPRAVEFAMLYNVDVEVCSSFNENPGTLITEVGKMEKQRIVSAVTHDKNCARFALFDVPDHPGVAKNLFNELAEQQINVDMIIQSAMRDERNDIAFTIAKDDLSHAVPVVQQLAESIGASGLFYGADIAKVSIIGAGMHSNPGVAATMFTALADENINIHMISTSEIKVSCIIDEKLVEKAVQALHRKF